MIDIISPKIRAIEGLKPASYYLGKKVYSKSGILLGRIRDIHLTGGVLAAIYVVGKRKTMIDSEFIHSDTGESVMLTIDPCTYLIGKQVFDAEGRRLGKVIDIDRTTNANTFQFLLIKRWIFSKPQPIPKSDIEVQRTNIILKRAIE